MFDPSRCVIKSVYCGNGNIPPNKANSYSKVGTPYECLKKGFGSGMSVERRKTLSPNSLQQISYVGPVMEQNLINNGIADLNQLKNMLMNSSADQKKIILKNSLINKDNKLNKKAYNSVLLWLNNHGVSNLPKCKLL